MRIVFISAMITAPWGGSEALWSQAAIRLAQQGHEVSASVAFWSPLSPQVTALAGQGIDLFVREQAPLPRLHQRLWTRLALRLGAQQKIAQHEWIKQKKPDLVVISQGQNRDGYEWMEYCREQNLPFAAVVQCNTEGMWPDDGIVARLLPAYRAARRIFCVSRHNLALLENQLGEALPNGHVVKNPTNLPKNITCPWPDDDGIWKIACVARMEPASKGQDILLQTLALPQWRERPLQVNFYGAGNHQAGLEKMVARLGLRQVHFRGHLGDIQAIWQQNHLLALPSRGEGLPMALVEAMLCGRAALITDVGGNAEVCRDGETGFIVPAPALSLWAEGMERAWERRSEWKAMGEAACRHMNALLTVDPVEDFAQQLLALK